MTLNLEIQMEGAAFEHQGQEVARIMREAAEKLEDSEDLSHAELPLRDKNGNQAGVLWVEER